MLAKRKEIIFAGDYDMNMNLSPDNVHGPHQALSNFCDQFCLTNVIREPTRITSRSESLLDAILVSHPERFAYYGNLKLGLSDHDLVFAVCKQKLPKPKARILDYRSTKDLNANVFITDLKDVQWDSAYAFDNPDDVLSHWAALLQQVIDKHAPVKRMRLRFKQPPWINPIIRKEMRHRNRLYKRFRRAPTDANWDLYRLQRNILSAMKRKDVKEFCAQAASDTSQGAVSSFLKKMKPLLPGDNACSDTYSISLIDDGQLIPDPARAFNEYFSTPVTEDSVIERTIQEFESHPSVALIRGKHDDLAFSFEHVSLSYVADILVRLDAKKCTGPDGLSPKILRIAASGIAAPLTKLFNYCFDVANGHVSGSLVMSRQFTKRTK